MARSREISDYFEARLDELRPGVALTFDVHLFFPRNRHIMLWRPRGDDPSADFLRKYQERGVDTVWILTSDREAFLAYRDAEGIAASGAVELPEEAAPGETPAPRTEAGAFMAAVLNHEHLKPEDQKELLAAAAQTVFNVAASAETVEEQKAANIEVRKTIEDVLDATADQLQSLVGEMWKLANIDPELEHSVNVATYAVTFALAFGRIEPELVADIALAGLMHDVGISQLPAETARTPWKNFTAEENAVYQRHVEATLGLLKTHSPEVPERVLAMIGQHHEKFNGTGYPRQLRGFNFDDIAQLVAMADTMDAFSSGQWDGQERTLRDTFAMIEKLETSAALPEHFNPDVFKTVVKWIRSNNVDKAQKTAQETVQAQAHQIIESAAG